MECITVLKTPNVLGKDVSMDEVAEANMHLGHTAGTCRFCSHCGNSCAVWLLVLCLLVVFVSSFVLHMKVRDLTAEVEFNKAIIHVLEASYLTKEQDKKRLGSTMPIKSHEKQKGEKHRHRRIADCQSKPHFQLSGAGSEAGGESSAGISDTGVFLWSDSGQILNNPDSDFRAEHDWSGDHVQRVIIKRSGLYYVFAQIHVNGYSSQRGRAYLPDPDSYPQDGISLSGLFPLFVDDKIFIQRPESSNTMIRYMNTATFSNFGAFMVEEAPSP